MELQVLFCYLIWISDALSVSCTYCLIFFMNKKAGADRRIDTVPVNLHILRFRVGRVQVLNLFQSLGLCEWAQEWLIKCLEQANRI